MRGGKVKVPLLFAAKRCSYVFADQSLAIWFTSFDHWQVCVIGVSFLPITGRDSAVAGLAGLAKKNYIAYDFPNS